MVIVLGVQLRTQHAPELYPGTASALAFSARMRVTPTQAIHDRVIHGLGDPWVGSRFFSFFVGWVGSTTAKVLKI